LLYKDITQDYTSFSEKSEKEKLSDQFVFQKISELDKKYKNNRIHYENFEGVLSNIGADQKSIPILNCVIKRLKTKKDELPQSKYNYDLGNTILVKIDIECDVTNRITYLLTKSSNYKEAKKHFLLVGEDDPSHFERASTNIANILEKYGCNYEALFAYDRALKINPNFGMALGNKAIALSYYIQLEPQQSLVLLNHSYSLLKQALNDPSLKEIGGQFALLDFNKRLESIERYFSEIKYIPKKNKPPKKLNKYQKFILDNNLYLNYDFGYYYDKQSLSDNFFPNLIEDIRSIDNSNALPMSKKVYFTFQVFNQIVEDFTTSRYIFYKALSIKCKAIDNNTNYVYTFDYTRHSLEYGMLKSVFSSLYSCLDKIAHQIKYNFSSLSPDINRIDIYFDRFTTDEFKKIILDNGNYQLLALHSLALDFKTNSQYYNLNKLRNRITHSYC